MKIKSKVLATLAGALCTAALSLQAQDLNSFIDEQPLDISPPARLLPYALNGEEAIAALGMHLGSIAARYEKTEAELIELLRSDQTLWIDSSGALFFKDPPAQSKSNPEASPAHAATVPSTAASSNVPTFPTSQTFKLHSKSGANRVIYLDFNGHTISGTAWNATSGVGTIYAPAYSLDNNASSFSEAEHAAIQKIWQKVSNDFSSFDVNVTTEEPASSAIDRANADDLKYGTRVVFTDSSSIAPIVCGSCGGVAYVNSFSQTPSHAYLQPAFSFNQNGGAAEGDTASHEIGHTLNLSHDGNASTGAAYYEGHGTGATSWKPIMGGPSDKSLTQWNNGTYAGANNQEDDLAIMSASSRIPYRADDVSASFNGSNLSSLRALQGSAWYNTFLVDDEGGTIERNTDHDDFKMAASEGAVNLLVTSVYGNNLDAELSILNSSGTVVATSNPVNETSASISTNLAAGDYVVRIKGVAKAGADGYPVYGSLGRYGFSGSYTTAGSSAPAPVLDGTKGCGGGVSLEWTAVTDADRYEVYRALGTLIGVNGWDAYTLLKTTPDLTTNDSFLVTRGKAKYQVRACKSSACSAFSNEKEFAYSTAGCV